MPRHRLGWFAVPVALWLLASAVPKASTVMQMNLDQMVQRADRIYRGTVLSVNAGKVPVGGGQLPITIYRLRVDEAFRGDFPEVKGVRLAEIRTVGKLVPVTRGNLRSAVLLPQMPELAIGRSYLVLTTRPSAIGLSTTVGLGQGCFRISQVGKNEQALNEANNAGLFDDTAVAVRQGARAALAPAPAAGGPITYASLAGRIRGLVAR
jgi:hypothetical protein